MKLLFCKLGLHWRVKIIQPLFVDIESGGMVYEVVCPCGKHWMTEYGKGYPFFKVPLNRD